MPCVITARSIAVIFPGNTHHLLTSEALRPAVLQHVLSGGDDYELVFTAPVARRVEVQAASQKSHTPVTRIGQIEAQAGLRLQGPDGKPLDHHFHSFDHFATKA